MPAAAKSYGQVVRRDGVWGIRAVPHVTVILKRLFIRADQSTPGVLIFRDTPEVARDLEWFLQRWPLKGDPDTLAYLAERAAEHRATEEAVFTLLNGYRRPDNWPEPARAPRGYQLVAADLVHTTGRVLLGDDVGLGKSFAALLVLRNLAALPALIVAPAHLCSQWLGELEISLPWLRGHITAKRDPYDLADRCGGQQPDVVITSYPKFPYWADYLAGNVATVIYDEIHELRRGTEAAKGRAAIQVSAKAAFRVGCSATPVHNYGGEIWEIIQPLDPDALGTRDEFAREWCGSNRGLAQHAVVKDPAALGEYLRSSGLMLRRTRQELHMELPETLQIEQPVDTDHDAIDQVAADLVQQARILLGEVDATGEARWHAASEVDWRLRRATGLAKAPYVAAFTRLLLESEDRIVMFGWHRDVYDIWLSQLADFNPLLYTGSETPAQKARHAAAFMNGESRILIMSLKSGAGLDGLQKCCSLCVFGELDWSPEQHLQCVGRLARDGQTSPVVAYFMTSDDGTDPHMAEVLGLKRAQSVPIRDPQAELFEALTPATDRARTLAADVLRRIGTRTGHRS